jgi:natural resistance-associated macrophage protein
MFLVLMMTVCFVVNMVSSDPDYGDILYGTVVPTIPSRASLTPALGLVGCCIMPHNIYLHSALVLTRKVDHTSKRQVNEANIYNNIESALSLFVSFIINTAVISTFAAYVSAKPEDVGEELDLLQAADALQGLYGEASRYIWALGLLAAGQSATMTGTYAGQFVMEGFLDFQLPVWKRVLFTRSVAIIPALVVSFLNPNLLTGMDDFLNVLQSIQLPFALIPLIKFVGDKKIMGDFAVSKGQIVFSIFFGVFLFAMNFVVVFVDFTWDLKHILPVALITVIYLALIPVTIMEPTCELKEIT